MANHDSPIVRGNIFIPAFKDRHDKALCPQLREVVFNFQVEEIVQVWGDDGPSNFDNFSLVSLDFPLASLLIRDSMSSKEKVFASIGVFLMLPRVFEESKRFLR